MRRKKLKFIILPILIFGALFVFRNQILSVGTKVCLNQTFDQKVTYQKISASHGKVAIQGVQVRDSEKVLVIEGIEFGLNFKEVIAHPKDFFHLVRKGCTGWNEALVALKRYGRDLSVQNGVLQLEDQRYYFQFNPGDNYDELGTLAITHDPSLKNHPFLVAKFLNREDQLGVELNIDGVPTQRLLRLATFIAPDYLSGVQEAQGQIQLKANALIKKDGQIGEISTRFGCENFQLLYPKFEIAIQTKKLTGGLNYPKGVEKADSPIWKKMECKVLLEKGNILWGEKIALSNLDGNLILDPKVDPTLSLKGELADEGRPLHLKLDGKGAVHEDRAYWLEFALNLNNRQGIECDAFLSICRPEAEDLVVQLEASNLLPQQVEMLKGYFAKSMPRLKEWEVKEGSVGGKLVALFEKGELAHFEVQNLVGSNIILASSSGRDPLFFSKIKGEGRLFDSLNFEIDLPAPDFFSFISPQFKEAYANYRYDDTARLSMTVKFGKKEVETSAHIDFIEQNQALQFGYKSKTAFPTTLEAISEGWLHSDRITHMLYGPFVRLANEDLNLYGAIDLTASFDGKLIECSLQIDEFLSKHPLLDLKAASIGEKGKSRAKFIYDLSTKSLNGTMPILHGEAYDRTYGVHFHDLTADLILGPQELTGHVASADIAFDKLDLLKRAQFDFSFGEGFSITSFFGQIALPSTAEFFISAAKFDPKSCDMRLLQGKEELGHFVGSRGEIWTGNLNVKPLKENLAIQFSWDPRSETAVLDAKGEGFHLVCKKQEDELHLEKLDFNDLSLKGVLAKGEKGFRIPSFELERGNMTFRGLGTFELDLPQAQQNFGIRSDLVLNVEMNAPFPVQLKTTRPCKLAYSPEMGLMMSDLDVTGIGCQLNIGQLEYLSSSNQTSANKCAFKLNEEFISRVCEAGVIPSFLRDFKICKRVAGEVNYALAKGKTTLQGTLINELAPLGIALEWKEQAGEFSFSSDDQNEKLLFQARRDAEGFHIDAVKGSLRSLSADLKKSGKDLLKGQVTLDLASIADFLDLPLNRYIKLWKTAGDYQFEGTFTPKKRLSDWTFKGKVKGQDFEWSGYQLDSIEAKIEVEPSKITIENLDISDDSGKLWIGEGAITRSNKNKQWVFSFPTVEIRSFQPSLLTKLGVEEKAIGPLVVKSATLENVRGKIDDLKSITGSGNLRFTNISKKGEKILPKSMPTELLKKMGLEAALFIPTSGEMEYVIENGKCYFRELQSVMTEKKRSQFEAPRNGSIGYIDFDGNLFINLQVKQNVVRGITAPLNLQVRGKWEEPQLFIK